MCSLRINVWHDHDMYLLRINSQIKTFHPNLQPRDIFYPLTFSWPWLFYKHPDKIDTFSSKSYCSMKINTVEPLLSCYTVPSLYQPVTDVQARHQQITEETTWGQPLLDSHLSLSQGGCTVNVVRSLLITHPNKNIFIPYTLSLWLSENQVYENLLQFCLI